MADESKRKGVTVRDVDPAKFISAYADVLKNNDKFHVPKWVDLVKTGVHKELAPYDPDWYYIRAGMPQLIFNRELSINFVFSCCYPKDLFTSWLRSWFPLEKIWWWIQVINAHDFLFFTCLMFGFFSFSFSMFRRGARPVKHQDSAQGLIRAVLLALDELKLTEKTENGGRRVTRVGQQALDLIAGQIANEEL